MRHKLNKTELAVLAGACVLLGACTKDNRDLPGEGPAAVQFVTERIAAPQSRVSYEGSWQTPDRIGIYMVDGGKPLNAMNISQGADNRRYKPKTEAPTSEMIPHSTDHTIWYPAQGPVDFIAYYPWKATGTGPDEIDNYQYPVDLTNQEKAEYIMVSRNATGKDKNSAPVSLEFERAMTKLTLILKGGEGILDPFVWLVTPHYDMPLKGSYSLSNGDVIPGPSGTITKTIYLITETMQHATDVVMLPGKGTGRQVRFELPDVLDGGYVTWKIDDDEDFEPGKRYTYTLTLNRSGVTVGERTIAPWDNQTEIDIPHTPDSWSQPNCYMVEPGGAVSFPVSKAYDMWRYHPALRDLPADLSGEVTAEILWADAPGICDRLSLVNAGYHAEIFLQTRNGASPGNIVIALKIGGVIRWSWHIWVTPYKNIDKPMVTTPGRYETFEGSIYGYDNGQKLVVFMDRDLGARDSVKVGDMPSPKVNGLYYQWGRKDPFVGFDDWDGATYTPIYDGSGSQITGTSPDFNHGIPLRSLTEDSPSSVPLSVTEPHRMYIGQENPWGNWGYQSGLDDIWGGKTGKKSPFDPCPRGWKVSPHNSWSEIRQKAPWDHGTWLEDYAARSMAFWPSTGHRDGEFGYLIHYGSQGSGSRWSAHGDGSVGVAMSFINNPNGYGGYIYHESCDAMPVRCVRE